MTGTLHEFLLSSVRVATGLLSRRPRNRCSIPGRGKIYSLFYRVQAGSMWGLPSFICNGDFPPELMLPGREGGH